MKKLLVLTPRFPYPVIGGDRLRIHHLCKVLASEYSLTLLSLCESRAEMEMQVPDDGIFARVERVYLPKARSYFNTLLAIPTRTPLQVAYYRSKAFAHAVERLLPEHDGALVHLIRCAEYVRYASTPRVLEMTDAISLNYRRIKELGVKRGMKARVFSLESGRLLDYERTVAADFDLSVLVSQTDKDFLFPNQGGDRTLVCSNGVDLENLPFSPAQVESKVLIFIGDMRTVQNLDMCHYFAETMLPLLRQRGDYRLRIVGAIAPAAAQQFEAYEGVEVTGRVPSIREAAQGGAIGVCPMRIGAGVQNKILEYMALGLPVVTTSLGYEGLHAQQDKLLAVADTPEAFVERIVALTEHPDAAREMALGARAFVEREHEWRAMARPLLDKIGLMLQDGVEHRNPG